QLSRRDAVGWTVLGRLGQHQRQALCHLQRNIAADLANIGKRILRDGLFQLADRTPYERKAAREHHEVTYTERIHIAGRAGGVSAEEFVRHVDMRVNPTFAYSR